jgi:3-deoxy-D-manno-octulosonate 8-phosphate phosphatase (KDO 8-P phosphatase)
MNLTDRAARISVLLLDVDGVLTDGRLTYTEAGAEAKTFHVRDGSALKFWQGTGRRVAIISGRASRAVELRAAELGITPVLLDRKDKRPAFAEVLSVLAVDPAEVCVMGDDLPDLPLIRAAGLSVAPADACREVRAAATITTAASGGHGAVREAIEWLMTLQGTWADLVARFDTPAIPVH